jgi:hypothetical protein
LLHLNSVWKQFHIFSNYPVCWWRCHVELSRKTFYRFFGTLHQRLPNTVNVVWCSDRLLLTDSTLIVDILPVASYLLANIYCRPAWCFPALKFHLEFTLNYDNPSSLVNYFY